MVVQYNRRDPYLFACLRLFYHTQEGEPLGRRVYKFSDSTKPGQGQIVSLIKRDNSSFVMVS